MSENEIWAAYEKRLLRVSAYIHEHLDEDLDLDRLSEIACLSAHHWHRVYRAVHNETLAVTVRRLRLHRAAGDLVRSERSVRDIAVRWGYPNLQSFTRTFAAAYGMPPARYRREGSHRAYAPESDEESSRTFDVTIRTLAEQPLLAIGNGADRHLRHIGEIQQVQYLPCLRHHLRLAAGELDRHR